MHFVVSALHIVLSEHFARSDTNEVWKAIEDPDKIVVAQVAPAVRAAWGEELGLAPEDATVGKIIDALKRMGINYVFDTTFSADLTIMEEEMNS